MSDFLNHSLQPKSKSKLTSNDNSSRAPLLQPGQVGRTFTLDGGEGLAEAVLRKPLQLALSEEPEPVDQVRPEGHRFSRNLSENLATKNKSY